MLEGKGMALHRDLPSMMPTEAWTRIPLFGRIEEDCLLQGRKVGYLTSGNTRFLALEPLPMAVSEMFQRTSRGFRPVNDGLCDYVLFVY